MPTVRYMRKGITKLFLVPTIASVALVPTAAEVNAGVNLTPQVNEINGFNFANSAIATPDMDSTFVGNIPGEDTAEASNLMCYELKGGTDTIKAAQPKGTTGFVVIFFAGIAGATPAAGDKADVWPVQVSANSRQYTAANEAARYRVDYTMSAAPGTDKTLT